MQLVRSHRAAWPWGRASPRPPPAQKQDPRLKMLSSKTQFPHLLKEGKSSLHGAQVKWKSTKHEESHMGGRTPVVTRPLWWCGLTVI